MPLCVMVAAATVTPGTCINDAAPPPTFVPSGFSTSNNGDALSFTQGSNTTPPAVSRENNVFDVIVADELDARDFVDFSGGAGISGAGGVVFIKFGLRDGNGIGETDCTGPDDLTGCINDGFLLVQHPNFDSIPAPEPGTLFIFGLGLVGIGPLRRKYFC